MSQGDLFNEVPVSGLPKSATPAPRAISPRQQEIQRLGDASQRVLAFLKLRGEAGALNWELSQPDTGGLGGVRRTWDLRERGYDITVELVSKGVHRYTLRGLRS